jgi:hypothetical protein
MALDHLLFQIAHTSSLCSPGNSYTQEMPTRFKKDVMRAAAPDQESDRICVEGMKRVLVNIGAEHRISAGEMKVIFQELGNETGEIPMQRMVQFI